MWHLHTTRPAVWDTHRSQLRYIQTYKLAIIIWGEPQIRDNNRPLYSFYRCLIIGLNDQHAIVWHWYTCQLPEWGLGSIVIHLWHTANLIIYIFWLTNIQLCMHGSEYQAWHFQLAFAIQVFQVDVQNQFSYSFSSDSIARFMQTAEIFHFSEGFLQRLKSQFSYVLEIVPVIAKMMFMAGKVGEGVSPRCDPAFLEMHGLLLLYWNFVSLKLHTFPSCPSAKLLM